MERGIYHHGQATAVGSDERAHRRISPASAIWGGRREGRTDGETDKRGWGRYAICVYSCFIVKVMCSSRCALSYI
jgi:hypothetical protein